MNQTAVITKVKKVAKKKQSIKPETLAYRLGMKTAQELGITDKWVAGVLTSLAMKNKPNQKDIFAKFFSNKAILNLN